MRIEIAGPPGSGKSTLCKNLSAHGYTVVYENFADNPYLELAQNDPETHGLNCQLWFVNSKTKMLRDAVSGGGKIVADFSLAAERGYLDFYLKHNPAWIETLNRRLDESVNEIGHPAAIIYLYCSVDEQMRRIKERGREFEQSRSREFVETLSGMMDHHIGRARAQGIRVLKIDTGVTDMRHEGNFNTLLQTLNTIHAGQTRQQRPAPSL